ncbi:MAG: lipopolysaccharide biosynthesis protein [Nevskia sp.]|nr:lipopolysaccharide biosynthesis protein [Nevskia sp.]
MTEAVVAAAVGGGALARVYRNAGKLLGGKAVAGLIGLVYLSLGARTLGPTEFGLLVSINFYALLVGNFCVLQGWHTVVRYGSGDLIAEHPDDFIALWRYVARIEIISGGVAIAIALALCEPVAHYLGWPDSVLPLALLYSLAIISNTQTTAAGVLNLFGRFDLLSLQQVSGPVARLIGAGLAWSLDAGLSGFLLAWLAGSIVEGLVQWALGLRELHRRGLLSYRAAAPVSLKVRERHPGILRFLLTNNLDLGLNDAAGRITPLAVGALLNPAAVGLYHVALRIGMVLQQPMLVIGRTVYPELAVIAARGEFARLRRLVLRTGFSAMAGGVAVLALFVAISPWLLRSIGGEGFDAAYPLLLLIGLARTLHLLGFPFGAALVALGRPNTTLKINLVASLGLLPVLALLLQHYQLAGAGLHALAYAVATVGALVFALLRLPTTTTPIPTKVR